MKQNDYTFSIVVLVVLTIFAVAAYALFMMGGQIIIDECNSKDITGKFTYKNSFICGNSNGERVTNETN